MGQIVHGDRRADHVFPHVLRLYEAAVDVHRAAWLYHALELLQGGFVHGDEGVDVSGHGRADLLVGEDDSAVRRAAPLLRAVAGQEERVLAVVQGCVAQHFADHHDALAAETGHNTSVDHSVSSFSRSRNTPKGNSLRVFSRMNSRDCRGERPQLVGQLDISSTKL